MYLNTTAVVEAELPDYFWMSGPNASQFPDSAEETKRQKVKWVPWDWLQAAVNTTHILLECAMWKMQLYRRK